jgi:hypothetical protein
LNPGLCYQSCVFTATPDESLYLEHTFVRPTLVLLAQDLTYPGAYLQSALSTQSTLELAYRCFWVFANF